VTEEIRQLRFAAPPGACRLLLLRHGETTPVRNGVAVPLLEGQSNPDLDPVGVDEARRAADRLAAEDVAAIYVTPLVRTHQTAAPLAERLGLELVVEPRLIDNGSISEIVVSGDEWALRRFNDVAHLDGR
jgi:2,3-bisphosphoglycerate-dependent phosphoglycerate mutase